MNGTTTMTGRIRELLRGLGGESPGEADELAALVTSLLARPIPDVTANASYIMQAVIRQHYASPGLREEWLVAAENPERGAWVTWSAYGRDVHGDGGLSYDAGHYFDGPDQAANRRAAMTDLAIRAGTTTGITRTFARGILAKWDGVGGLLSRVTREDARMARHILKYLED